MMAFSTACGGTLPGALAAAFKDATMESTEEVGASAAEVLLVARVSDRRWAAAGPVHLKGERCVTMPGAATGRVRGLVRWALVVLQRARGAAARWGAADSEEDTKAMLRFKSGDIVTGGEQLVCMCLACSVPFE